MSGHNKRYEWLRRRLDRWGAWKCREVRGLGYPSTTPEARLTCSPGRSSQQDYTPTFRVDTDATEVDHAIQRLAYDWAIALHIAYVDKWKTRKIIKHLGLESRHDWHRLIERAERELAGLLRT